MNLQKQNNEIQVFNLRSLAEQRFKSPSVKQLLSSAEGQKHFKAELFDIITQTYFLCGQKIENNDLKAIFSLFYEEIQPYWYLTIDEIKRCFKSGYKQEFGEYYGLSVKTFILWIDYYVKNVREEELSKRRKEKIKDTMTEDEKSALVKSGMWKCIQHYEINHEILDGYIVFMYDVLLDDKLVELTAEEKKQWYADAKELMTYEMHTKKPKTLAEREAFKELKRNIEKNVSSELVLKAKEMIVMDYLRKTYKDQKSVIEFKARYAQKA